MAWYDLNPVQAGTALGVPKPGNNLVQPQAGLQSTTFVTPAAPAPGTGPGPGTGAQNAAPVGPDQQNVFVTPAGNGTGQASPYANGIDSNANRQAIQNVGIGTYTPYTPPEGVNIPSVQAPSLAAPAGVSPITVSAPQIQDPEKIAAPTISTDFSYAAPTVEKVDNVINPGLHVPQEQVNNMLKPILGQINRDYDLALEQLQARLAQGGQTGSGLAMSAIKNLELDRKRAIEEQTAKVTAEATQQYSQNELTVRLTNQSKDIQQAHDNIMANLQSLSDNQRTAVTVALSNQQATLQTLFKNADLLQSTRLANQQATVQTNGQNIQAWSAATQANAQLQASYLQAQAQLASATLSANTQTSIAQAEINANLKLGYDKLNQQAQNQQQTALLNFLGIQEQEWANANTYEIQALNAYLNGTNGFLSLLTGQGQYGTSKSSGSSNGLNIGIGGGN